MNRSDGKRITGIEHLRQSVTDILTTPIGSRVMRRDYGSRIFDLIDRPLTDETRIEIVAATAEALLKWESRLKVSRVSVRAVDGGHVEVDLYGTYTPDGRTVELEGLVV